MNDTNTQATQEAAEFVERLQFKDLPVEALRIGMVVKSDTS